MCGNSHTLSRGIVGPSVVGTHQARVLNAAAGKFRAAMETEILPRAKALGAPPQDEVVSEEARRPDVSRSNVRRAGNDVPIVD